MSENVDVNKLVKALDNNSNESIINLTTRKIMELNLKILKELMLDLDTTIDYLRKLKGYKYVDELNDLKYGSFIRWMPIIDPENLTLNQCGMICDIKITDDGVIIVCKNFLHRHYTFKMDEVLIFQKLTPQERVIISALDHLENEDKKGKKHNSHHTKSHKSKQGGGLRTAKNLATKEDEEDEEDDNDEEDDDNEDLDAE
jgi:hypothetical protein